MRNITIVVLISLFSNVYYFDRKPQGFLKASLLSTSTSHYKFGKMVGTYLCDLIIGQSHFSFISINPDFYAYFH